MFYVDRRDGQLAKVENGELFFLKEAVLFEESDIDQHTEYLDKWNPIKGDLCLFCSRRVNTDKLVVLRKFEKMVGDLYCDEVGDWWDLCQPFVLPEPIFIVPTE